MTSKDRQQSIPNPTTERGTLQLIDADESDRQMSSSQRHPQNRDSPYEKEREIHHVNLLDYSSVVEAGQSHS